MTTAIQPQPQTDITTDAHQAINAMGQAANQAAADATFTQYRAAKSDNTLRAHDADLGNFSRFLCEVADRADYPFTDCPDAEQLSTEPQAWQGVTWGLLEAFRNWMQQTGYSIGSINRNLSTVRTYAKLAAKAGVIDSNELRLIGTVSGYSRKEGKRINERRTVTRVGHKKAAHVTIGKEQAGQLKRNIADTEQAIRDNLLMCLLLDHGLRVSEVCGLQVTDINLKDGTFEFYRVKVDREQTHRMSNDTLQVMRLYFDKELAPTEGPLLRGSRKGGRLTDGAMSPRAVTARVRALGEAIGIEGLSAHDCRHYWATRAATAGTDAFALRDAGGWSSLAMPSRYVEAATIANERVKL